MALKFLTRRIKLLLVLLYMLNKIYAQQNNCTFKDPLINIDFGVGSDIPGINIFPLQNYNQAESTCPDDGYYSFVSNTSDCFGGDWLTFNSDHTGGNKNGRMMLVNASPEGGVFFNTIIAGLKASTSYEFAAWMVNVCRISGGCAPLPPDITIKLITAAGKKVVSFQTGLLAQNASPRWRRYTGFFTTPADATTLVLTMEDITNGGCGNDFALDDITFRECIQPLPVVKSEVKPLQKQELPVFPPVKKAVPVSKAAVKKIPVESPPLTKKVPVETIEKPRIDTIKITVPAVQEKRAVLPAPKPILTRANPLIKQIETAAGEVVIDLYDNGDIDGDTVSIYHNNELIVSRAGLSARPNSFHLKVDAMHPHHELIMVANNLGSIPPNTSMMIITTKDRRYEVFISSSEQKNAKIVIDLKE